MTVGSRLGRLVQRKVKDELKDGAERLSRQNVSARLRKVIYRCGLRQLGRLAGSSNCGEGAYGHDA